MSLARAFTSKRTKRQELSESSPNRAFSTKHSQSSGTIRHKISAPVELISTTNMQSYNAPDLHRSSASSNSGDESDSARTSRSSPPTSPDTLSLESSPCSPEPNHLSNYFGGAGRQSTPHDEPPVIPQRAVSHTKKTHELLHGKRSTTTMPSPQNSVSISRNTLNMFSESHDASPHPFGNELAQVSELAEEFGATIRTMEREEMELASRGLRKFGAEDYLDEIQSLFETVFGDDEPLAAIWI